MKLAILGTRGIPARYGGFETFAEELSVRLVEKGAEVTVFCEAEGDEQLETYRGVRLVYVSSPSLGPLTTILFDLRCLWQARKGFDTVYMLGYGASVFCFIPRLWGSRVWINMDGIEWARAKWSLPAKLYLKVMEALAMRIPNRIVADAEGIREFLQRRHRRMPPCSVVPYGAEIFENPPAPDLLAQWGLEPSSYFLVVCRLEPENHVMEVIEGYAASRSELPLVVVGNHLAATSYVRSLFDISDERIKFIGAVYDPARLQTLRYYCKAYFHGHSVGGTNPSLLEALGCGNLVIAHDNPFNREVAGDLGLYFKGVDDIPLLMKRVEGMDGKTRSDLSAKAMHLIENNYTWQRICYMYMEMLNSD